MTSVLQSSKLVEILIGSSTSQKIPFTIKSALTTTPNVAVRPIDTAGNTSSDSCIEHCYAAKTDIGVNCKIVNCLIGSGCSINLSCNTTYDRKLKDIALQKANPTSLPLKSKVPLQLKGKFLAALETR